MAHDITPEHLTEPQIEPVQHDIGLNSVTLGFSLLAGGGVTAMIVALAIGVIQGAAAGSATGLLFVGGLLAFIAGSAAWLGVARPFTHFDDINIPMDLHGHGDHADHDADHNQHPVSEHPADPQHDAHPVSMSHSHSH